VNCVTSACNTLWNNGVGGAQVTAANINSAESSAPNNTVVRIPAGRFNLTSGVTIDRDFVALRGQGADQTVLTFSGITPVGCHLGDGKVFQICKNGANIGVDSPDNTATWTAGYAQGTTVITISAHTNLVVGSTIWLDQLDETADGFPATGDIWTNSWGNGESLARASRGVLEGHIVTACGTSVQGAACTSNSVTIDTPIWMPDFRSSQSPGAWWGNAGSTGSVINYAGVENLTIDATPAAANAIDVINGTNCWIKGVRTLRTDTVSGGSYRIVQLVNVVHSSIVDNYFYGIKATGLVDIYGFAPAIMSSSLVQNNIIHASVNPNVVNSSTYGSVFAYNYFDSVGLTAGLAQSSTILHGAAGMNLWEGNNGRNFSGDNIHIGHFFNTLFRNHHDGAAHNPNGGETEAATALYAVQRFFNVIGNVFGSNIWSQYQNGQSPPSSCQQCIYELGWEGTNSGAVAATGNDTHTATSLMRWGNWDLVTSSNDTGTNDQTGTRFVSAEVPSGLTNFPNPVPSCNTPSCLPASFYLSSVPSWFGSVPFPPIGPDVFNGNAPNTTSSPTGGHANKIPARLCFEAAANDPAYSTSPPVKLFSASKCYQGSSATPPAPPTGLSLVVN